MSNKVQFQVSLSFMQIYMENITDLLDESKDKVRIMVLGLVWTMLKWIIGYFANSRRSKGWNLRQRAETGPSD